MGVFFLRSLDVHTHKEQTLLLSRMHAMAPVTYDKPRPAGECSFVFGHRASFFKRKDIPKTVIFLPHGATAPSGSGPLYCRGFTVTLSHT